ncbi:MAG: MBOAT family protein [Bacteroidia bacterium]|nr:MBOAT family protein [Bacteroidia bacterium]
MVFSGVTFLFYFLPLFLLVYILTPNRFRNYWLLAGSVVFYAWGAPKFVFVLLASTIIDFYIVRQLHVASEEHKRKRWLALSITLNLGLLVYFKYANFFVDNINEVLTTMGLGEIPLSQIILPIGISFYTFQTLTYSIDIYRRNEKPLDRVSDYVLYIMMFPQLIAGPIVRFSSISKQLVNRVLTSKNLVEGFIRFSIGLGKKVLLANTLAIAADAIMSLPPNQLSSTVAWFGILCYTFQIYFDFAGYSDMAIGLGKMLGFRFPENFESPYTAVSITDFWRKWHITLGGFMRDYLYLPLGGNRSGVGRTYRNLFLVFVLSGLWHGASWNFVLWGVFHGFFLVLERLTGLSRSTKMRLPRVFITFLIVALGWVIFRIENLGHAQEFYAQLFSFNGTTPLQAHNAKLITVLLISVFFSFVTLSGRGARWRKHFYNQDYAIRSLLIYFVLAMVIFVWSVASLSTGAFNPFIYFRF